jgi:hypothetical protein
MIANHKKHIVNLKVVVVALLILTVFNSFSDIKKEFGDEYTDTSVSWTKLTTEPYNGKQDDICFVDENLGWYVNGGGNIFSRHATGEINGKNASTSLVLFSVASLSWILSMDLQAM